MAQKRSLWKWILGGLFLLLVLLVVGVYAIVATYDFNQLKPKIEQAVLEATGRELSMHGDIELNMGLRPALSVHAVSLENAPWGSPEPMADVQRFELQVALWPLLQGQVEIRRLILVRPQILVESGPEGQHNFEFEKARATQTESETMQDNNSAGDELDLPPLTVYDLHIKDAVLRYRDFKLNDLRATADSPESKINLQLDGTFEAYDFAAQGSLGSLQALLQKDLAWPLDMQFDTLGLQASIQGHIQDILTPKDFELQLEAQAIDLEHLQELAGPDIKLQKPLQISAHITDTAEQVFKVSNIDTQLNASGMNFSLEGHIENALAQKGLNLKFAAKARDLDQIQDLAGPNINLQEPVSVNALIADAGHLAYKVSGLDIQLADSNLQGTVDLDFSGSKPEIKADLKSQLINLAGLLADIEEHTPAASSTDQAKQQPEKIFPDQAIDTDFLDVVQAELQLTVEQMLLPGLTVNDLRLTGALQDQTLLIDPFQARAGEGDLQAVLDLQPTGQDQLQLEARARIKQIHLEQMLQDLGAGFDLQGKMDLDLDVTSNGNSAAELMAGLNGTAGLAVNQGQIYNRHIASLSRNYREPLQKLFGADLEQRDYADINCCITLLDIEQGTARIQTMILDTDFLTVLGGGRIDLGQEKLDISLDPSPKQRHLNQLTEKLGFSLGDLASPFKIGGTLAQPRLGREPEQITYRSGRSLGLPPLKQEKGSAQQLLEGQVVQDDACLQVLEELEKRDCQNLEPERQELLERGQEELQRGADKLQDRLRNIWD